MRYGIALGSNLGSRFANLQLAVGLILARVPGAEIEAVGGVYDTAPVDCPPGSDSFYNSVVEIESPAEPSRVLEVLRGIESFMGRDRNVARNAPRIIDLDILYASHLVVMDTDLEIPHPRLGGRRFVLQPLCDIRPDMVLPKGSATVKQLLAAAPGNPADVKLIAREWLVIE